jgi:lipoprotein-anchoring transpeptidase ErfK/SrfK
MVTGTGGGGLRCRTAPVTGATITVMPEGALVDVRGNTVDGWAPVKCAGQNGWASATYLNFNVSGGATGELWMDVNLSTQYMRVYRGSTVIAATYVSTGRPGFDTPTGTFYVNWKLPSQTMSGVLGGEYYYVPNVPWVMYFTNVGHAIHGAYWHNNFGRVMSHGCINLPVSFAEWLYSITPYGTRIRIHY